MTDADPRHAIGSTLTPEMRAAAVKVIADIYGVCSEFVAAGLAEDVFKAMIRARTTKPRRAENQKGIS